MAARMRMIFTKEQLERIQILKNGIFVDVHGMTKKNAFWFIKNIITLCPEPTDITICHGYNNGTALKEMLHTQQLSKRVKHVYGEKNNQGRTHLLVA